MKELKYLGIRQGEKGLSKRAWALFECPYCGAHVEKSQHDGRKAKSCGCARISLGAKTREKHGDCLRGKKERIYKIWCDIKKRCRNKNHIMYKHYGRRGIDLSLEWESYVSFKKWSLLNGYSEGKEIDRINNDGNYSPENCRWVDHKTNSRNRRIVKLSSDIAEKIREEFSGEYGQIINMAKRYNVSTTTIKNVLENKTWA